MSVGILIITHNHIGADLIETARCMLHGMPLVVANLPVSPTADPDEVLVRARKLCNRLDTGAGILVLTDMFGSTPSNIACRLCDHDHEIRILAGLNLPMLIRIFNYPTLALDALKEKALSGGHDGIFNCQEMNTHGTD